MVWSGCVGFWGLVGVGKLVGGHTAHVTLAARARHHAWLTLLHPPVNGEHGQDGGACKSRQREAQSVQMCNTGVFAKVTTRTCNYESSEELSMRCSFDYVTGTGTTCDPDVGDPTTARGRKPNLRVAGPEWVR